MSGFSLELMSFHLPEHVTGLVRLVFRLFFIIQSTKLLSKFEDTLCIVQEPLAVRWAGKVEQEKASVFASLENLIRLGQITCYESAIGYCREAICRQVVWKGGLAAKYLSPSHAE